MEVDQSSAGRWLAVGPGAAADRTPETEATAELNAVTIRRLGAVYVLPSAGGPAPSRSASPQEAEPAPQRGTDAGVDAALTALRALGYRLSAPAREAITSPEQAWALVNAAACLSSGSPSAEYRPFYPDFPIQVRSASEAALLVNAALHYLGDVVGARILPAYWPSPREPLPEYDSVLTELDLATEQDLERIAVDLFAQATPFSVQDRADLTALRDHGPSRAPHVAVKENLAVLTVAFPGLDFSASYRTVTDVLRLAVAMAGGDVSLAEPCRFPSFSRAQRRRLLGSALTPSGRSRTAGTPPRRWLGAASGGSGWPATCAPATTHVASRAPPRSCTRSPPGTPKQVSPPAWRRPWCAATSREPSAC